MKWYIAAVVFPFLIAVFLLVFMSVEQQRIKAFFAVPDARHADPNVTASKDAFPNAAYSFISPALTIPDEYLPPIERRVRDMVVGETGCIGILYMSTDHKLYVADDDKVLPCIAVRAHVRVQRVAIGMAAKLEKDWIVVSEHTSEDIKRWSWLPVVEFIK